MADSQTIIATALGYLAKGWSVIPVGVDKRPLVSWKEYQTRLARTEEVLQWWDQYPEAQVGIVTGSISNLMVIDIEEGGDFSLVKDKTFTVKTGGGGIHYYFLNDPSFQNAVRIMPLMDIRAEGGYVVAAPSKTTKGDYVLVNSCDKIPSMSSETRGMLVAAKKPTFQPSFSPSIDQSALELPEYPGYGPGQRNDQMAKHIGSILARTHPSEWETKGWTAAQLSNMKNTPPLPEYELRATWNSLKSREMSQNPLGRSRQQVAQQQAVWGPTEAPAVTKETERDKKAIIMHASEVAALQTIDTSHTYSTGMKPFDDALLGGFSVGDLISVAGKSGVGKTSLILDWSVTLASRQKDAEGLPTLWFSYEVLARPLWEKFEKVGASSSTPIYLPSYNESGNSEWVTEMILQGIKEKGIKVVAIDHLGFLRPPKGNYANNADAITHTVRMLKHLAVDNGLIIMLPVHVRKTNKREMDQDDVSDSKGIVNESDALFFIDRMKGNNGLATEQAKVWLSKNRKSGVNTSGIFDYKFGRYFYNEEATRAEGLMEEASQRAEEAWKRSEEPAPLKVVAPQTKEEVELKKEDFVAPSLWVEKEKDEEEIVGNWED